MSLLLFSGCSDKDNKRPSIDTNLSDVEVKQNSGTTNYEISVSDADGDALTLTVESNNTDIITTTQDWDNPLLYADYHNQTLDFNLSTVQDAFGVAKITINLSDAGGASAATSFDVNVTTDVFQSGDTWKGLVYKTVTSPFTGKVWLDRNLGATQVCTALDDTDCYGDYYQWGRDADGHEKPDSSTTATQVTDLNTSGNSSFITTDDDTYTGYDWVERDSGVDDDGSLRSAKWSSTDGSSICPIGYRVPTEDELKAEIVNEDVDSATAAYESFLKLPSAGQRYYQTGDLLSEGHAGLVWSSSAYGSRYAWGIDLSSNNTSYYAFAYAFSVRCVKD
jgi:uncharacterized protein (TIGR02145 family)